MKNSDRWLLFQQLSLVPKHVTLSQKIRLAFPASIPASCFFDQEAVPNKNSKGDLRRFPNWDWKISKQSLSISEHCKNTTHHTKWPCLLQLFSSFLNFWPYWRQVSCFACSTEFLILLKSGGPPTMSEKEKNPGGCHTKKTNDIFPTLIFQAKVWIVPAMTIVGVAKIASQKNVEPWSLCKEAE